MRRYTVTVNSSTRVIDVEELTADTYRVQVDGRTLDVRLDDHRGLAHAAIAPTVEVRRSAAASAAGAPAAAPAAPVSAPPTSGAPAVAPVPGGPARPVGGPPASGRADRLTAPMPGVVLEIRTSVGEVVSRGQTLMVLEAMKMKNELKSPRDGTVDEIYVAEGAQVKYGEALVRFEES
ncbi:biotin/lipoyl-containing protein [Aestuariimicrobium ganziense]|uniref:biotin/lipoyl-containing protein n=1 Tax=Aestuariimicrobium ganziense TaxID=2773677 RepID=UPI001944120F|nr:acetyl-CoA carboxylase biotin carboxyl carrier protein subunit [Aestuariimicrobium ganziense]